MSATLWDSLGGEEQMTKIVSDFVDIVVADPRVNYTRGGRYPLDAEVLASTKRSSLEFLSQAMGGPLRYSGRSLQEIHGGMNITEAEFAVAAGHFKWALEKHGVSAELIEVVMRSVANVRGMIVGRERGEA
jgi:hemoglobin